MAVRLPSWPFDFHEIFTYMTLCSTSGSLGLSHYITLIENKPILEMWETWLMNWIDMTWHENAGTFVLLLECMSSYNSLEWWMYSWCTIASPLNGEVRSVFYGHWFAWWSFSMLFLAFKLEGLIGSRVREGACLSCLSASHASFLRLLVNLSICMCSFHSSCSSSWHVFWCTCTCNHSWWDDIKSKTS